MSYEFQHPNKPPTRILLVQLTYPSSPFPGPNLPVGLGYIAEQLELNNISYDVIDLSIDSEEYFFNQIARTCPEYIALSMMSLDADRHYELAFKIKKCFPLIKIIAGGAHVSFIKEKALRDCSAIDFGVVHEGEQTLIELLRESNVQNIKGLLYHEQDGRVRYTGPRALIDNLDELAFPRYRKFKLDRYGETISLDSSRGCPFCCTFCGAFLSMGKTWRARSVKSIIEEVEYWQQKGYSSFNFIDSNFFMSKQRVIELCDSLSERNFDISLSCDGMRAKDADPFMLKKMKQFGLQRVAIGIESANDDILHSIKKGETLAELTKCLETLLELDINVIAFFIIGLPGESIKHVLNSFKFALKYPNISAAYFFNPNPLPGTELYAYAEQHNMLRATESQILENIGGMGTQSLLETEELPIPSRNKLLELSHQVSHLVKIRHQAYSERHRSASIEGTCSSAETDNIDKQISRIITFFDEFEHSTEPHEVDDKNIFTHLTPEEKHKLTELAMTCSGSTYVELGSYLGASSCFIASGIVKSGKTAKLYCVDTWTNDGMSEGHRDTFDDFLANTRNYKKIILPLRGKSYEIAKSFDKEIDFLFIDAGHDFENVKSDVLAWFPKLRAGARVVFHDIGWAEGVQRAVKEYVQQIAHDEGALPNMYWACVSQPLNNIPDETLSRIIQQRDPSDLIRRLATASIPVTRITLDINDFISWLGDFQEILNRYANSNDVFIEKCLEHYIAFKFAKPEPGQVFIDVAAAGSNWTDCLERNGVQAYSLDLTYPAGIHGNKIGANAAATCLPDNSVDAMSLQCAFETFRGDDDKHFLRESSRILKDGGKVVISPLYLDARHFILSGKNSDLTNAPLDAGAIRVWREDDYDEDFSRHYSPEALADRILPNLEDLSPNVLYIENLDEFRNRFPGQRIYCDFNLYISKQVDQSVTDEATDLRQIYNDEFYNEQKDASYKSAESIVPILMDVFNPRSVTDIGCGAGGWLHVFKKSGVNTITGYDVNELSAEKYFIDKNNIQTNTDFSSENFTIQNNTDLLTCLEVAEHLPNEAADSFILKITSASPVIIFSAALPGQTGVNHINEQPPWYWREKFNKYGYFEIDFIRPQILRDENICWWYRQNITCFVRPDVLSLYPKLAELATVHGQNDSGHKLTVINEWVLKHIMAGEHLTACPAKLQHDSPFLSVIVPTRNRAALLYNALESLTKQTYPATLFEIIVVDNGSTDATADVCHKFKQRFPQLKRISVADPGLHNGRHAGLKEASGEILVYADDDIEAMPTWLEAIASSFRDPKVALVGGKILPKFENQPPEWVAALGKKTDSGWSLGWYSILDFGDTEHEIPHEYVWGCNFSIRKNVLQQVGGFHPDSFPQEFIKYRGDGETAVSQAIQSLGLKAFYNPKASVYHVVSQNRLTQEYIYQRAHNQGISDSYTSIRTARLFSEEMQYKSPTNTIHDVVDRGYVDGFNYHQQLAKSDETLLNWILKESYINCEDVSL